jgi:hypothetical protein
MGAECRGTADLPEHVTCLRTVDKTDPAGRRGDQRRGDLEDEHRVRVMLPVQCQSATERQRTGGFVHPAGQRLAHQIPGFARGGRTAGGIVVSDGQVRLSLPCRSVTGVGRSQHNSWGKAGISAAGTDSQISMEDTRAGVGHRLTTQDHVAGRGSQPDRALRGAGAGRNPHHHRDDQHAYRRRGQRGGHDSVMPDNIRPWIPRHPVPPVRVDVRGAPPGPGKTSPIGTPFGQIRVLGI